MAVATAARSSAGRAPTNGSRPIPRVSEAGTRAEHVPHGYGQPDQQRGCEQSRSAVPFRRSSSAATNTDPSAISKA